MHILLLIIDVILAGFIAWEVVEFVPRYRQLKQAVANGDPHARMRIYQRVLRFEWISASLAVLGLGFDWSKLNPKWLGLTGTPLMQPFSTPSGGLAWSKFAGVLVGLAAGTVGFIVVRIVANRRGAVPAVEAPPSRLRKLMPDFSALLPVTPRERLLWAAAAISAGICEETVFRGWLLATLHGPIGLNETALVLVAAAIFGLAHAYQGTAGMILVGFLGVFFCVLYVASGSLLVPILLHVLVDVRFALMPAPRAAKPQTAYA
jgi:membrane protease YdiL (CAAX protease family)